MDIKYNAFISYRHSELDSQVAADIQRRLERYRIPSAIKKKTGKRKIERVFRDKEELPTTSDLNDDIGNALKNADYLIVICSPRLKESTWCLREIETFLQYQDRTHVLTVLAEGEPGDVIPDIILYDEIVKEDGTIEKKPIEPLSCDYRLKKSKRVREEFPRLAAMIIGCSYNDLVQRQKQYRQRRLTAIFGGALAIVAGFLVYAVQSNMKISENYNRALTNQSLYLTQVSQTLLEEGNREEAIKTALAALPDEDNDRPLVNEPLYALNNALYSYQFATMNTFAAVRNFESQSQPTDQIVYSDDTGTYAVIDDGGYGYILDSASMDALFESRPAGINEEDTADFREVYAYEDGFLFFDENAFYYIRSNGEVVYSQQYAEKEDADHTAYGVNDNTVAIVNTTEIMIFNAADGSLKAQCNIVSDSITFTPGICFSPAGNRIAVYAVGTLKDGGFLYTYDRNSGELKSEYEQADIANACFIDEDTIAFIKEEATTYYYLEDYRKYASVVIACMDLDSDEILWQTEEKSLHAPNEENVMCLYKWADSGNASLQVTSGNELKLFDPKTGEDQFETYYGAQIVHTDEREDGSVLVILNDGSIYQQYINDNADSYYRGGIGADITGAEDNGEYDIVMGCDDDRRYVKLSVVTDESVTVPDDELTADVKYVGGDISQEADIPDYVCCTYDSGNGVANAIRVWNADTMEVVFDYVSEHEDFNFNEVNAVYKDGELYIEAEEQSYSSEAEHCCYYHLFKAASGEELTEKGGIPFDEMVKVVWVKHEDQICACTGFGDIIFYSYEGKTVNEIKEETETASHVSSIKETEDGKYLAFSGEDADREIRVLDIETLEWVEFEEYGSSLPIEGYDNKYQFAKNHDQILVYTADDRLLMFDLETGKIEKEIPFNGDSALAFDWFDDDSKLILSGNDNYIQLWDVETNSLIMQESERTEADSIIGSAASEYFVVETGGLSTLENDVNYIYQVDEDGSFHKYAAVENGDLNPYNQMLVIKSATGKLGVSHIYSLDELLEKADAVVGDERLTEEEKNRYFIN